MPNAPLSTRRRVLAAKIEQTEGTAETLTAAEAKFLPYDLAFADQTELFQREPVRQTFSPLGQLVGAELAEITARIELRGSGSVATASPPAWKTLTQLCALAWYELKKITIGAITSGPFLHNEVVTQATSGATGKVKRKTSNGTTTLYVYPTSGSFNGTNVITGATSGASATPSAVAVGGWAVEPISTSIPSGTVAVYEDGTKKLLKGARGSMVVRGNAGEPMFLEFRWMGVNGGVTDATILSPTLETTVPPTLKGAGLLLGSYEPQIVSVELDMQGEVAPRKSISAPDGAYSAAYTGRRPVVRLDPEYDLVANFDYHGALNAATRYYTDLSLGTVEGNRFVLVLTSGQITALEEGERDQISTLSVTFDLIGDTGNEDAEFSLLVI